MSAPRLVGAIILIALGLILLAGNVGLLDWDYLAEIWRLWQLWPLILVALGIYLFLGRRRRGLALGLIALVLVLGLVLAAFVLEPIGSSVAEDSFTGPPVEGIETATLIANLGAARLQVDGDARRAVVEADYRARGEVVIADTGADVAYEVEFDQRGNGGINLPFFGRGGSQFFEVHLAPDVPWDVEIDVGAVDADLDFRQIRLRSLRLDAGASSVDVRIGPETEDGAEIRIEGGVGSYKLAISRELDVTVRTDGGLSSRNLDDDFEQTSDQVWEYDGGGATVNVEFSAGVSSLDVELY